ncbi:MAG: hypothetical protein IJV77_05065 [Clostridia bacterium]|nr:hypothetical protein [Clostridia bacterium]
MTIFKKLTKKDWLSIGITLLTLSTLFLFSTAWLRFFETVWHVLQSVAYYFVELFCIFTNSDNVMQPGVANVSSYVNIDTAFPLLWSDFELKMQAFWPQFFNASNFGNYLGIVVKFIYQASILIMLFAPPLVGLYFVVKHMLLSESKNDVNEDSKALVKWRKLEKKYQPAGLKLKGFFDFLNQRKIYVRLWLCLWLINLNVFSMAMELVAWMIYFIVSFDVATVYLQVYKLSMDVALMFSSLPTWAWFVLGYILLSKIRRYIGLKRLRRFEQRNKNFINNKLNLVILITGSMGSKKTTTLTDIMLSQEVIFRQKAFELIQNNDMKFPLFPWAQFENDFDCAIDSGLVFNLTSARLWVRKQEQRFYSNPSADNLFGYDYTIYPTFRETELVSESIFDVLETYAQLYFVYTVPSSLALANYSIRSDNMLVCEGHFPVWDMDFFERTPEHRYDSNYAHILDFDDVRLGKRIDEEHTSMLEFACVGITEIGKERGNQVELQGIEKMSDDANQKNDLFNYSLKMSRHKATIDNYPFIRFYTDEQRASSWGADAKELCTLLNIADVSDENLAMPFFYLEDLLHNVVFGKFISLYYDYRTKRSDNCLTLYLLKKVVSFFHLKHTAVHDKYGYFRSKIETRSGTLEGGTDEHRYYLCKKKIYSDRFSTDCYSEILTAEVCKQGKGLQDVPTYGSTKPTLEEFKSQNSYFIQQLLKITNQAEDKVVLTPKVKSMLDEISKKYDYKKVLAKAYDLNKRDIAEKLVEEYEASKKSKK